MVSTDPISDMLTRIRNGIAVRKNEISMPHSKMKQSVAEILVENRFIEGSKVEGTGIDKSLVLTIMTESGSSPITEINRLSKPGRRVYAKVKDIPKIKKGRGLVIVSTSQGIMTGDSAKAKKLGGEVLCSVY
jgi:small subunit ribosomal protein S8